MISKIRLSEEKCAIFLFHGVVERHENPVRNYTRKHLDQNEFRLLLEEMLRTGTAVSMDEVITHTESGEPYPKNAFAITFDDGFENNYSVAAPILRELNIPATFYISTDFIENNTMSWIDRIELALEMCEGKNTLRFEWSEEPHEFEDNASKIAVLSHLRSHVKKDPEIVLDRLVENIYSQLGLDLVTTSSHPLDQKMTWGEVRSLHDDPLFIVGGHSHEHLNLAFLSPEELDRQINTSIDLIKEKGGFESVHYAYPEGLEYCYSQAVIDKLKSRGIVCSPTAIDGLNDQFEDLFHLRRIML